jgi:hypothetical protein
MNEMELPAIVRYRIPTVIAMAIGEVAGLIYFYEKFLLHPSYGGRAFIGFLLLCLMGSGLIVPYLWNDWLERRQIRYFGVVIVAILGPAAVTQFMHGKPYTAALNAAIALLVMLSILPRLLRTPSTEEVVTRCRTTRAEGDHSCVAEKPMRDAKYAGMLLSWLIISGWLWSHAKGPIPVWIKSLFLLPALWLASLMIFHFLKRARDTRNARLNRTS